MAKGSPRVKVTYTYNGITFSTASKVVAKMAKAGNMKSAYKRSLSDTVGRQLRTLELSEANRLQYLRAAEMGKIEPERIVKAVKSYKEIVAMNIADNIKGIYGDIFNEIRDIDTRAARKLLKEIDNIISKYAWAYDVQESYEMNQEIQTAIEKFKEENAGELSESDMDRILKVESSFGQTKEQYEAVVDQKLERMRAREAAKGAGKG